MNGEALKNLVLKMTKCWTKQRKAEEREASRASRRRSALVSVRRVTAKDAAWRFMKKAYMKASSNNTLPAHARQIMYAARGDIQDATGKPLNDQYFSQTLLPDFMAEHPEETESWDVVFDARGHLTEPHTKRSVPLGTLDVRGYLEDIEHHSVSDGVFNPVELKRYAYPTEGPTHRYSAILFIEKEGFGPLLRKVKLAERYDIAIMSTKGMSSTASRILVDRLCASQVPLLVVHDLDKAGFSIAGTLQRDTRRYEFENQVNMIDLGLRLSDVEEYQLETESVHYGRSNPIWNLRENGATEDEIKFLCDNDDWRGFSGKRVELNAFASNQLVEWIETKLAEQGIEKVIPDDDVLSKAYRRAKCALEIQNIVEGFVEKYGADDIKVPESIRREVSLNLNGTSKSWDDVVWDIAESDKTAA